MNFKGYSFDELIDYFDLEDEIQHKLKLKRRKHSFFNEEQVRLKVLQDYIWDKFCDVDYSNEELITPLEEFLIKLIEEESKTGFAKNIYHSLIQMSQFSKHDFITYFTQLLPLMWT